MIRLVVIIFLLIPVQHFAQHKIQFIREQIDFTLNAHEFSVNGIYYFYNNSEHETGTAILFPFAENAENIIVKRVFNLSYGNDLEFRQHKNALTFKLQLLPGDTVKVNIAYSQKASTENVYVLTSTQSWGQALQKVDYSLKLEEEIQLDSLSLKPDKLINHVYYWEDTAFFPKENFIVWTKQ